MGEMAKQANRKLIGGFVVFAVGILAASVVIFGSGDLFKEKREYVLYFEGSVKGLSVGSPVLFRGVQVGVVKRVVIRSYLKEQKTYIPVFIEIYPENFQLVADGLKIEDWKRNWKQNLPELIKLGLRAQLVSQSLITGQLAIEIGEYPDTPIVLKGLDKAYPEVPTIPSTVQRLSKALEKVDLEEMNERLQSILSSGLDTLVNNPRLAASMAELEGLLKDVRTVVENLNTKIGPLTDHLNGTLTDARELLNTADGELKPLADNVNKTLEDFSRLARDADTLLDPSLAYELESTLNSLSEAARSLQLLSEYLKRHPDAMLKGKSRSGGD
jgi:paraquat-inducible protein B